MQTVQATRLRTLQAAATPATIHGSSASRECFMFVEWKSKQDAARGGVV
jgi:hypothetical protein